MIPGGTAVAKGVTKGIKGMVVGIEILKEKYARYKTIKNPDTIAIAGKYHVKDVVHYYNPKTNINVMKGTDGQFISGWKLTGGQRENLKAISKIGGGK